MVCLARSAAGLPQQLQQCLFLLFRQAFKAAGQFTVRQFLDAAVVGDVVDCGLITAEITGFFGQGGKVEVSDVDGA